MKIPDMIEKELNQCPVPYKIVKGTNHYKIFVPNIMCGIFPQNGKFPNKRAGLNVRSQIRRQIRKALNEETNTAQASWN